MNDIDNISWFVLRVRFNRAMRAQSDLTKLLIETYLPMEEQQVQVRGKKIITKLMPIFPSYIFVKTTFQQLNDACMRHKYFSYISNLENGLKRAIRVPTDQMNQFQDFIEGRYYNIEHKREKFTKGEKVIVTSGPFKGSEATFIKEKGNTRKIYLLEINGIYISLPEKSNCVREA